MVVFVTYLHVADRFGCHTLEAFSGLRLEGWKSHLRLRVSADELVVRVIGFDDDAVGPPPRRPPLRPARPHVVETFRVPWGGSPVPDPSPATSPRRRRPDPESRCRHGRALRCGGPSYVP